MEINFKHRVPELDGLRGLAILVVILGHYINVPAPKLVAKVLSTSAALSWSGVDLFFVLSGFLIGGILLDVRESGNYFQVFYARRFFRIFPVYYAWLILYVLLLVFGRSFLQSHMASGIVPTLGFETWSHFLYLQNFVSGNYVAISEWCLGATWSLAVEEQFYLIAPLAVRFLNCRTLTWSLVATVAAAPLIRLFVRSQIPSGPDLAYTLMFCRADALALGMLVAIAVRDDKWKLIVLGNSRLLKTASAIFGVGMIAIWIWAKNPRLLAAQSLGYTWIAFFYASILLLSIGVPFGPIAKACRTGFLRELGRVSYCMYIIHLPIQLGTWMLLTHRPPQLFSVRDVMAFVAALGITYGIARVSWIVLEHPMLQVGHRWSYGERAPVVSAALSLDRNV